MWAVLWFEESVAPDVSQHRTAGNTIDESDESEEEIEESKSRAHGDRAKSHCKEGEELKAGKCVKLEEGTDEDSETTDDLQETFQRRNNLLFEKLCKWSKK